MFWNNARTTSELSRSNGDSEVPSSSAMFVRRERIQTSTPYFPAHILWKEEALEILRTSGLAKVDSRVPRSELYRKLSSRMTVRELSKHIKCMIMRRDGIDKLIIQSKQI